MEASSQGTPGEARSGTPTLRVWAAFQALKGPGQKGNARLVPGGETGVAGLAAGKVMAFRARTGN